jgi:hypothetical protein
MSEEDSKIGEDVTRISSKDVVSGALNVTVVKLDASEDGEISVSKAVNVAD